MKKRNLILASAAMMAIAGGAMANSASNFGGHAGAPNLTAGQNGNFQALWIQNNSQDDVSETTSFYNGAQDTQRVNSGASYSYDRALSPNQPSLHVHIIDLEPYKYGAVLFDGNLNYTGTKHQKITIGPCANNDQKALPKVSINTRGE